MENKPSMSRVERLHREKVTRYSIRKYSFGAASVAVAALFMFLGNGAVSANELSKQETSVEATTPTLDKTQLESYISEIETKLSNGSYDNKTEESVAVLKADLEAAKATLANATTQAELKKAYSKLVTTANAGLRNKPVEKKETPAVDTTEGKETVGKTAENTEPTAGTNSIENTGSNDARNGKELDKNNAFRTEATAATHEATTNKVGNISYTMEFSDDAKKEIYLYNQEDTNIDITVNSTAGNISSVKVRGGGNRPLDEATKDSAVQIDGFGWSYTQTLTETAGPVTMNITGKTNERFLGLTPTNRREDQNSVLGDRYLVVTDTAGGSVSASSNGSNQPGFFKLVVKSQTYKYDIKDLTEERRITVNDIDNITPTELASIKSRLKLEYSKKSNDARFVRGATVANPTSLIDTVAVSTTEPSKLVVTYKDGSVDTIEKSKVLNVKPVGIIPFSNPTAKEIYVYKGEETNIEFGVTDDSGKIKDLRIVQGSAIMGASGAEKGQVRNEYGLTMTSETNANGIEATTANPAITRITGTVDVPGKPKFVGPLMTRYLVAEDLDGALFSNPDANKNMDQEGAFKLVVREQTQKYDVQLQGAESNKIAVADVNNLSAEDFEKIKNNIKIVYNTADDARLKDKDETRHGSLVKNASQYIQSITNSGNNIVVTYKDGSTDTIEKTSVLRSAPGPVVTKTARANGSLNEDGIYSTDRTLKGTGTPGATIKVSVKDEQDPTQLRTLYDNVTVGTDGNWSVDLTHGLYSNITNQTQLYPREPLSVTQTVNGLESVETVVSVALGDSKVLPSEASKDGASVVAGSNKLVVKVPHDAGIAYVDYKNKETDARSELAFKRENKDSQWTMKDASKATITSVTSDGFYDTVTLEMKEKIKEGTDVRVVSNIYDGKYSSPVSWVSTPVSNEKPTLTSANGQTETTVNVGDTVNPVDLVTAADHEDDKNATLGTKGTTEVVSVNGDETVKTIDTTTAGSYVVKYKVVDSQGKESDVLTHTVIVNLNKQPAIDAVTQAATAQIEKINGNTAATKEEKDAAIAKVNNDKQAAIDAINAGTVKTQDALTKAQNAGTTAISADNPVVAKKDAAKADVEAARKAKEDAIKANPNLTQAEKDAAIAKNNTAAADATKAIDTATTNDAVDQAKTAGTTAIGKVNPVAKENAKEAIANALTAKNSEIDKRTDLSDAEKKAAKDEAQKLADAELAKINAQPDNADTPEAATAAQTAVDNAKDKGVADVKSVNPVAKEAAKKAIADELTKKEEQIDARTDLITEEKEAAKAEAKAKAKEATDVIDAQPSNADTPEKAAEAQTAVNGAKDKGVADVKAVDPVAAKKPAAKKAIDDALTAKNNEIDARTDLTPEDKTKAKEIAKAKADAAKDAVDKATTDAEVDKAKTAGTTAVANVTPVAKEAAKTAIADALTAKNKEIDARTDLTDEEKTAAKNEAKDKADAQLSEIAKQPDAADTPAAAKTAQDAVDAAKKTGVDEVTAVNPAAVKKPAAKKAIDDALTAKNNAIDARTDLTDAEKKVAKDKAAEEAKKAKEAIDAATTDAAVDTAKTAGLDEVAKVNPVAKEAAKKVVADELDKKEAEIDARTDLTQEEKDAAKKDAQAKAKEATDAINAQPDNADTPEAATAAQTAVDNAKDKGVADVKSVNPEAVTKPAAKKAIDDKLAEQLKAIENTPDATDDEKKVAADAAKDLAEEAKKAIDKAGTDAEVKQLQEEAKKAIEKSVPVVEDKPNARKAIEDEATAKKEAIDARDDLTPKAKEDLKAQVDKIAEQAKKSVDAAKTAEAVNGIEESDKAAIKAVGEVNIPADKVLVNDPSALTDDEKAKVLEAVKKVNPDAKEITQDADGNITVTTPDGHQEIITPEQVVKTADTANDPKAGNDVVKPADKVVVNDPAKLTDAEKEKIKAAVETVNPNSVVTVDEKGNAKVSTPDGQTQVIPVEELVRTVEDTKKPNAGNDIVKPADKTVVANPDALTPEEKKAIEDKVKAVNPGSTVVVDDKGNATVTTPEGKTAVIPASDLTKSSADTAKPNAGNDIVKPADKTVVANPDALTPEEKKAIEDKVKAVNPGSTVVVDDKGNATVTTPEGKTAVIPASDLTKSSADAAKPNAGNDIVKPADKTVVANPDALTPEEKKAIEDKVKAVNPGSTVVVDDKGNATVTTPEGKTAVIPASDLTKSSADAAKPNAGNDIVKPADKTVVANPDALTPEEKKAIEDKVKAVNPGATVVVDDKGNATVTTPEGKTAVIPASDLTKSAADAAKPNAGNDIVKPADKTVVANPDKLTDAEKKAIEDKVKAVNPGSTVVVDDKGNATVTTPEGKTAVIPASDLTKSAADAAKPNAGNDIVKPADKTVVANPDALTPEEKKAIEDKVKAVNPGSTVVVDDKGNATVTTPEGKTAVIPASDLTKSSADAAKPNAGNDIVKPADKTVVANPDALTPEEKKAIEDKVKAVNPGATVVVDDKGNATVTTPEGKTAVIPASDLTKSAADAAKPNAGNDIVKPADKTVVANPDKLTDAEKKAIEDKVKAVNPGSTVVVDDKGNATVTTPEGKTAVIPASDLTKSAADAAKPNAGNDIVKPADKTVVANPDKLTDAEKKAIEDKVKAVNPGSTVVVDDKGNATVTTPEGKTAVIPASDLTKSAADAAKPNAGNDIVKPADKTVVANPDKLTDAEKKAIEDKVKAVNPGSTVVVDDKGNATVTTPEGKTAVIPASDLTKSAADAAKPNAGNDIVKPADKTVVANPDALTPEEKKAIEDKVKAVNPGSTVVVDDKGNATVTTPEGKTAVIPASDLTKSSADAAKPNAGNDIVKPADKTVVANPDALTPEEKKAIEDKVKAVNPGATVVVDDKGNATVTTPEGKTAVIPASDLTKSAADAAKPNAGNDIVKPADKTVVANPDKLTDAEKKAIEDKVKAVNPGSTVVVDDKGNATVTTPEGKTAVIPASDLTKSAADAAKPNAGNDIVKPADKTVVANPDKLTDAEKKAIEDKVKAVNPGSTVVVDDKGNATVTTPEGKTAVIPATDLTKSSADAAKPNAGNDIVKPADKTVVANPDKLTDAEKKAIEDKVKAVNSGSTVVVDDKGNATVTTPEGKTAVIPATDLTKSAADAAKPNAGNDIVKPADKTVVANPDALTPEEKKAIEDKVKAVNPGSTVVVDDKGNATVTTPEGKTAVIPASDLTKSAADAAKPNAGNDIVKPADKTVVANPDKLTDAEKKAIEDKVKAVNSGSTVVVDDKGNATVTTPEGKTAVIPATDLTKSAADAAKPNAGNDIVKPADKTVVANPDALTPEEKKAIEDKVKAVNPGSTVVVDDKGNATVTTPEGKTAVIPASDLTKSAADAAKPNAGNDIVKPADKTVVANPDALTPEEKKAIEDKVKAVNPGSTVVVDDKGNATVTTPEGKTAVIPASDLTKSAADAAKANAGNAVNTPAAKVEVKDPAKLTDEEKAKVKEAIEAVNPGSKVVVDDKGNATVTTPEGNTAVIPAADVTKSAADAAKANAGNAVNTPAAKVEVKDPANLTDAEKKAIEDKVKAVNPGSKVVVDDKGNATVTTPEGKTATIPATDLTKSAADAAKANAGNGANTPATKTVVKDPANLTDEEKAKVKKAVEDVNPGSTVVVNDKGDVIVTKGDGTVLVIPELDLVIPEDKLTDPTQQNGVNTPATRVLVGDKAKLTADEIEKVKESIKAVNPGATVVVDENGNATVTTPEGKTATIPAAQLVKDAKDVVAKNNGENINLDFEKETVADLNNLTDAEKEAAKAKIKGANADVVEVIFDKAGNATVITKDGKVYTIVAKDIFTQRSSNTGPTVSEHTNARKGAKELPYTGTADSTVAMVAAAASALLGLGLAGRRRKEDEEA